MKNNLTGYLYCPIHKTPLGSTDGRTWRCVGGDCNYLATREMVNGSLNYYMELGIDVALSLQEMDEIIKQEF